MLCEAVEGVLGRSGHGQGRQFLDPSRRSDERHRTRRELVERGVHEAAAALVHDVGRSTLGVDDRHRSRRHRLDHADAEVLEAVGVLVLVLVEPGRVPEEGRALVEPVEVLPAGVHVEEHREAHGRLANGLDVAAVLVGATAHEVQLPVVQPLLAREPERLDQAELVLGMAAALREEAPHREDDPSLRARPAQLHGRRQHDRLAAPQLAHPTLRVGRVGGHDIVGVEEFEVFAARSEHA